MNAPKDAADYNRQVTNAGGKFVHLSTLEKPESGSKWSSADILTFRVVLTTRDDAYPSVLKDFLSVADQRLNTTAFRNIVAVVKTRPWQYSPRNKLRENGNEFGSFLCHLAEVLEPPCSSEGLRVSDRLKTDKNLPQYYPPSDVEADSGAEEQEQEQSESSDNSDRSHEDQDTINRQNKSEMVTGCLIIEYLQSLAQCTKGPDDQEVHLEWTTDEDTFQFQVPSGSSLTSRNDGGLVYRCLDSQGRWTRAKPLCCYCSIEASICTRTLSVTLAKHVLQAKAAHNTNGKKIDVLAQEVSQIIGMIHQREQSARDAGVPQKYGTPLFSIYRIF